MNELELCWSRERKALRRRLVLRGLVARKVQAPVGPLKSLVSGIRQMTLGDGVRVELPTKAFEVPDHMSRPGLLKRAWRGFKAMVRRRT
jgi:hypothetical protein